MFTLFKVRLPEFEISSSNPLNVRLLTAVFLPRGQTQSFAGFVVVIRNHAQNFAVPVDSQVCHIAADDSCNVLAVAINQ